MTPPPEPATAAKAPGDATGRHQVSVATRSPWWLYLLGFLLVAALLVSRDYGRAGYPVVLAAVVLLGLLILLPRRFPDLAARLGRGALAHRRPLSGSTRAIVIVVAWLAAVSAFVGGGYVVERIEASGAPQWVREHPWTVFALVPALLMTVVGWLLERWLLARSARRRR